MGVIKLKRSTQRFLLVALLALAATAVVPSHGRAAYLRDYPFKVVQPDGEVFDCFVTGDEFRHRVHDAGGYTIVKDPKSGWFVYAAERDGRVVPSPFRVGRFDPAALGIPRGLMPEMFGGETSRATTQPPRFKASPRNPSEIRPAPLHGGLDNLVIFIRFSDETDFNDPITLYLELFDFDASGYNSLYNYFREASYGQLSIKTFFFPVPDKMRVLSYKDSHPRKYFQAYDAGSNSDGYRSDEESAQREQQLLKRAVDAVSSQVPQDLNIDGDGDGYVDNVCFVVKGDTDGWGDLLWPHMWSLYLASAQIHGLWVSTYNFQLEDSMKWSGAGVLCHEMFHSLGSPDLYHYSGDGLNPVGAWDIMESDLNPPQHMGAYMKYKYGQWISSIPEITTDGTYSLYPLTSSTNNCYKIRTPGSAAEFFVVEYRKKTGTFESSLPGEGLLVYRINPDYYGNADGPPDEVYVYRPDGTLTQDGQVNDAPFSQNAGRTIFNDHTNPYDFLSDGSKGGLSISQVSPTGETISFHVSLPPSIILTAPDKTTWTRGTTRAITWEKTGKQAGAVRIRLVKGGVWVRDIALNAPNTGRYAWRIPKTLSRGRDFRVRVETVDNQCSDQSPSFIIR